MLIGDSAFPFRTWLLKPYTKSVLDEHQRYFNYRLSRARMVTECAYGQLKGRWRFLLRKSESKKDNMKVQALACVCLHNLCIGLDDTVHKCWNISNDEHKTREEIREMLNMRNCHKVKDTSKQASKIRDILKTKFWNEKTGLQ